MTDQLKINNDGFPDCAVECQVCKESAVIDLEGQDYCLNCGTTKMNVDIGERR